MIQSVPNAIKKIVTGSMLPPHRCNFVPKVTIAVLFHYVLNTIFLSAGEDRVNPLPPFTIEELLVCLGKAQCLLSKTLLFF